jgi:hypothetical protein
MALTQVRKGTKYSYKGQTVKVYETKVVVGVKMVVYTVIGSNEGFEAANYKKFLANASELDEIPKPYGIFLASKHLSDHATFPEALEAYKKYLGANGLNMRNGERSDVDYNGITEEEQEAIDAL